jgi:hypothetical protein
MIIAQLLRPNDAMQIRLHEFLNQVNLGKFIKTRWAEDVKDGDNVFVLKVAKKFDLAEGAETEHRVIEWGDSLDGDFALCWGMNCRAKGQLATSDVSLQGTDQTTPYAPSPITSRGS